MLCEHFKDSENSCNDLDLTENFSSSLQHRKLSALYVYVCMFN